MNFRKFFIINPKKEGVALHIDQTWVPLAHGCFLVEIDALVCVCVCKGSQVRHYSESYLHNGKTAAWFKKGSQV